MKCPRCKGHGIISSYKHVEGGICFLCYGVGAISQEQYTEYEQDENKKAEHREKAMLKRSIELQKQRELHEQRLKSGYYKAKAEAERKAISERNEAEYRAIHGEYVSMTAAECMQAFFVDMDI